jgi:GNAT superfamily N-acetyltransferase
VTVTIRPMQERDVEQVHDVNVVTFDDLTRRLGEPPEPRRDPEQSYVRHRHLLATDAGGAWVAERDEAIVGAALAIVREGVWGLSLLIVHPDAQSEGVGRELLDRAHAYGDGARGRIVLASRDHRAVRAYLRLGLDLHPAGGASGRVRDVEAPGGVRPMRPQDRPWLDEVGRAVRGAAHGDDLDAFARSGAQVVVLPERGYAVRRRGALKLLAAREEPGARALLRHHLAAAGDGEVSVEWLTSSQQWAIRECLDAGLRIDPGWGAVLTAGDVGPFRPYLPSGAYL